MIAQNQTDPLVLIIEPDETKRNEYLNWLSEKWNKQVITAKTFQEGLSLYGNHINSMSVILISLSSGQEEIDKIDQLKSVSSIAEIIVLMDTNDTRTSVEIMKKGTYDILTLPSFKEEIQLKVKRAMELDNILKKLEHYVDQQQEIDVELRREEFQKFCNEKKKSGGTITQLEIMKFFPPPDMRNIIDTDKLNDAYMRSHEEVFAENNFSILVIEDEEDMRETLADILSADNISVLESDCGKSALNIINSKSNIDLIILDIGLPDITGDELLKKIREILPDVEVIIVTAFANDVELVVSTLRDGACDYITKPIEPKQLLAKITDTLVKKHIKGALPDFWREIIDEKGG